MSSNNYDEPIDIEFIHELFASEAYCEDLLNILSSYQEFIYDKIRKGQVFSSSISKYQESMNPTQREQTSISKYREKINPLIVNHSKRWKNMSFTQNNSPRSGKHLESLKKTIEFNRLILESKNYS